MVKFYKKIVSSKGHISILAATGIEVIEDVVGRGLGLSQGQRFPIEPGSPLVTPCHTTAALVTVHDFSVS